MNFLKKIVLLCSVIFLAHVSTQIKTYPHIPLKGLFNILKIDDIGFGHSLLHSRWIENIYQYGDGKAPNRENEWEGIEGIDPIVNLVRKLWFRYEEDHSLEPTIYPKEVFFPLDLGKFGKLIDLVYKISVKEKLRKELGEADAHGNIESQIKKIKLPKLRGRLNEYRKALEKKLFEQEGVSRLDRQSLDNLNKFKNLLVRVKEEVSQVNNEIKRIALNYKKRLKEASGEEKKELNFKKREEIAKIQEKSAKIRIQEERLHEDVLLALADYTKDLADAISESSFDAKIHDIAQKILERKKLSQELESIEKPKGRAGAIRKAIKNIEAQERRLLSDGGELRDFRFLIKRIIKALEACKKGEHLSRTVEGVLWAFFFHKIDKLTQDEKIEAINQCISSIEKEFKNKEFGDKRVGDLFIKEDLYTSEEFDDFEKEIKGLKYLYEEQVEAIFKKYDLALHFLINKLAGKFPSIVEQSRYGYEYEKGELSENQPANCYETAMEDLFSILWYNPEKQVYDNSLFKKIDGPGFKRFREALKYFYLAAENKIKTEQYTVDEKGKRFTSLKTLKDLISEDEAKKVLIKDISVKCANYSVVKQEFMNILSGVPGVKYVHEIPDIGKGYELEPDVENFLKLFNYFYGVDTKTIEDLGKEDLGLFADGREVKFEIEEGVGPEKKKINIHITVKDEVRKQNFVMMVNINPGNHAELLVPDREIVDSETFSKNFVNELLDKTLHEDDQRYVTALTLFTSKELLEDKRWDVPTLRLVYYSLIMKDPEVKLAVLRDVFSRGPQYYDIFKGMVNNLIEQFPIGDHWLGNIMIELILKEGYKEAVASIVKNPKFRNSYRFPVFNFLLDKGWDDLAKLLIEKARPYSLRNLLDIVVKKSDKEEIAELIVKRPEFDASSASFFVKPALKKGWNKLVTLMAKRPKFEINVHGREDVFRLALQRGLDEVVTSIIKQFSHPDFLAGFLKIVVEQKNKKIIEFIMQQSRFSVIEKTGYKKYSLRDVVKSAFILALKEGWDEVVASIIKKSQSKALASFLKISVEQKNEDAVKLIVQQPKFDVRQDLYGEVKRDEEFGEPKGHIKDVFILALKEGWDEVVKSLIKKYQGGELAYILEKLIEAGDKELVKVAIQQFAFNQLSVLSFLDLILKKEGWDDVVQLIIKKSDSEQLVACLQKAVEEGDKQLAKLIISQPAFHAGWKVRDAFRLALQKEGWDDVVQLIIKKSKPEDLLTFFKIAIEEENEGVAKEIIESPVFDHSDKVWSEARRIPFRRTRMSLGEKVLFLSLKKGYVDIAKKYIEYPFYVEDNLNCKCYRILPQVKTLLEKKPEKKDDIEKIIKFIEEKVKGNIEKLGAKLIEPPDSEFYLRVYSSFVRILLFALKKDCIDIAKKIIEYLPDTKKVIDKLLIEKYKKSYDWNKSLSEAKKLLEKKPERKEDIERIIIFIEQQIQIVEKISEEKRKEVERIKELQRQKEEALKKDYIDIIKKIIEHFPDTKESIERVSAEKGYTKLWKWRTILRKAKRLLEENLDKKEELEKIIKFIEEKIPEVEKKYLKKGKK